MTPVERLAERIDARTAVIAIVGMGYVGLPLMLAATGAGFRVLGFDIDGPKVVNLNKGRSPLRHVGDEPIRRVVESGRFEATAEPARLGEADAILVCVPTPIGRHREPDLSFVEGTAETILPHLRAGCLVVLESTTWPGTTRELLRPILERGGLASEETLFLAYSPEREDPGNPDFNTSRIPKVVGGDGPKALAIATRLYAAIVEEVVPVSSAATAEAVKLTENVFRAVNIALVNELKLAFEPMGIDIFEVIHAAGTKPFGFMPFYPGPGLGGHCIPIDPFYLTWKAREHGVSTRFIELAGEINTAMPHHVLARTAGALDARLRKGLNGSRVMVLGVAYKKNVDDVRESPALRILDLLAERGAETLFHDPYVDRIPPTREHPALTGRRSSPLDEATLASLDAVLIVTDHDAIDYADIAGRVPVIIDTRGRLDPSLANVFRA
ncbi:MAG: nucleotide sugar dehydrogenase [Geminicoccaceae bacterium]